eukprot:TRINITY_DN32666_c0_g3_i1.p1 TRINITY_DN32666_c0_g3~~TRINITY_DN32666_c0_g3_i1.p1  ORF type:complete len:3829 (+),score=804.70 TRINITY_DN32666_c0_g3_i1:173-11659(+)
MTDIASRRPVGQWKQHRQLRCYRILWAFTWFPTVVRGVSVDSIALLDVPGSGVQSGAPFTLEVRGTQLPADMRIRIVDASVACGSSGASTSSSSAAQLAEEYAQDASATPAALEAGQQGSTGDVATSLQWPEIVVLAAGNYRVCACTTKSGSNCDAGAEFATDAGEIQVSGPSSGQTFNCRVGWPCSLGEVTGVQASVGDRLRVMQRCFPPQLPVGFLGSAPDASAPVVLAAEIDAADTSFNVVDELGQADVINWGATNVSGLGRKYELCWCAASLNCTKAGDFLATAGELRIPGPSHTLDVLCAAGRPCHFSMLATAGLDMGVGDRAMVRQSCEAGNASAVSHWPHGGLTGPATAGGVSQQDLVFDWEVEGPWNTTVGSFKLCWCRRGTGHSRCEAGDDFRMEVGTVAVAGAVVSGSAKCTIGQPCNLPLTESVAISAEDGYVVRLNNCSIDAEEVTGLRGAQATSLLPSPSTRSTSAILQWSSVTALPGYDYALCWKPVWLQPSQKSCDELLWSPAARASSAVCAGSPDEGCTAAAGNAVDFAAAAASCSSLGARLCLPQELTQGEAAAVTPCGGDSGGIWSSRSCSQDQRLVVATDSVIQGVAPGSSCLSDATTRGTVCCGDTPESGAGQTVEVPVGRLTVRGPLARDSYCVQGEVCRITVPMVEPNFSIDMVQVVLDNVTCGQPGASINTTQDNFVTPRANPSVVSQTSAKFSLGVAMSYSIFQLCWCGKATGCRVNEEFNIHAGFLLVGGITVQSLRCVITLPCQITLNGTNLGVEDTVLLLPESQSCSLIAERRADPLVEVERNPATTEDVDNSTVKRFDLGRITRYGYIRICYCINFGSRQCLDGKELVDDHYSMTAGLILVQGPEVNESFGMAARTGVPYDLPLQGLRLVGTNRISIVPARPSALTLASAVDVQQPSAAVCGEDGSEVSDSTVLIPSPEPVSTHVKLIRQQWENLVFSRAGDYQVCWCAGDYGDLCDRPGQFAVLAARFSVSGLWSTVNFSARVGNAFPLMLRGLGLSRTDRVLVVPEANSPTCTWQASEDVDAEELVRFWASGVDSDPSLLDNSVFLEPEDQPGWGEEAGNDTSSVGDAMPFAMGVGEVWRMAVMKALGRYAVCWCGRAGGCAWASEYAYVAAYLTVSGPEPMPLLRVIAGETFSVKLTGTALSTADRISIVDHNTECGSAGADYLASAVVALFDEDGVRATTMAPSGAKAAVALGRPATVAADGTEQGWDGLIIRWMGRYKVCWSGEHEEAAKYCVESDGFGGCNEYQDTNMPFYVGDIEVDYGAIMVTAPMRIDRCDSLELVAVPPRPHPQGGTATSAQWSCSPNSEFCRNLQYQALSAADNLLWLTIPAEVIDYGVGRARFISERLGQKYDYEIVMATVVMVDAENVTRRGSTTFEVVGNSPMLTGVPEGPLRITPADELLLSVYAKVQPEGVCKGTHDAADALVARLQATTTTTTPSPIFETVPWSIQWLVTNGPAVNHSAEVQAENTGERAWSLKLAPQSVADILGIGLHRIVAVLDVPVEAGGPAEVEFVVEVLEPPPPVALIAAPAHVTMSACPAVFDASGSYDAREPSEALMAFEWDCQSPANSSCAGRADGDGAIGMGRVLQLDTSAGVGTYNIALRVTTADGRSGETSMTVDVLANVSDTLSATPLSMPAAVSTEAASEQTIECAAAVALAADGDCATLPDGLAWSVRRQTDAPEGLAPPPAEASNEVILEGLTEVREGGALVALAAALPTGRLEAGHKYRCVLRQGEEDVAVSGLFTAAGPPRGGRVSASPRQGRALHTRFSLAAQEWIVDELPLQSLFFAVAGDAPSAQVAVEEARWLRGWSNEATFVGQLPWLQIQSTTVVGRVRDGLGATAQAHTVVELTAPEDLAYLVATLNLRAMADFPPNAQSVTAAAAKVLSSLSAGADFNDSLLASNLTQQGLPITKAMRSKLAGSMLQQLHNALQDSDARQLAPGDLALRAWVMESALDLAGGASKLLPWRDPNSTLTGMEVLESSVQTLLLTAEQAETQAKNAHSAALDDWTADRLAGSLSELLRAAAADNQESTLAVRQQQNTSLAAESLPKLRSAANSLGGALLARQRGRWAASQEWSRSVTPKSPVWESAQKADMEVSVIELPSEADGSMGGDAMSALASRGLTFGAGAVSSRRLSEAGDAGLECAMGNSNIVRLTRWSESPVLPSPYDRSSEPIFLDALAGVRVRPLAEASSPLVFIASTRIELCDGVSEQESFDVSVSFVVPATVGNESFYRDVINGSMLETYDVHTSWVCMQFEHVNDTAAGRWRAEPEMLVLAAGSEIECKAALRGGSSQVKEAFIAAVQVERAEKIGERLAFPKKDPEFAFGQLTWLFYAVAIAQLPLILFAMQDTWEMFAVWYADVQERREKEAEGLAIAQQVEASMNRKKLDDAVVVRLVRNLRAAVKRAGGLQKVVMKIDKDGSGTLSPNEFRGLLRKELRIPPAQLSDQDIDALVAALDDDGHGELSVEEIDDFIQRGFATFHTDAKGEAAKMSAEMKAAVKKAAKKAVAKAAKAERFCNIPGEASFCDGLYVMKPRCSFRWWCTKRKAGADQNARKQNTDSSTGGKLVPIMTPTADEQQMLMTQPPLREKVRAFTEEAIELDDAQEEERLRIEALGSSKVSRFLNMSLDTKEMHKREQFLLCLKQYRRFFQRAVKELTDESDYSSKFSVKPTAVVPVNEQSEPVPTMEDESPQQPMALRVAHHAQAQLLATLLGNSKGRLRKEEEAVLDSCQKALLEVFDRASEGPAQAPVLVGPYFAPPCAVRLVLVSQEEVGVSAKSSFHDSKSGSVDSLAEPAISSARLSKASHGSEGSLSSLAAWEAAQSEQGQDFEDADPQPYLIGGTYHLWLNCDVLYVHRAETLLQDEADEQPLDCTLSRFEQSHAYSLSKDVLGIESEPADDRILDVSLRTNSGRVKRVLRFRGEGELRAWSQGLQAQLERGAAAAVPPVALLNDLITMEKVTESVDEAAEDSKASFQYSRPSIPHTACDCTAQTASGELIPLLGWYSHGGMCLSLSLRRPLPGSDAGALEVRDIEDAPAADEQPAGADILALEDRGGAEASEVQCLGFYLEDMMCCQHDGLDTSDTGAPADAYQNALRMKVQFRSGEAIRLRFGLRFMRILMESSMTNLRKVVHPGAPKVERSVVKQRLQLRKMLMGGGRSTTPSYTSETSVAGGRQKEPKSPVTSEVKSIVQQSLEAVEADQRSEVAQKWRGNNKVKEALCGCLELTILSASSLGLQVEAAGLTSEMFAIAKNFDQAKARSRGHLPLPQLHAFVPTQAPPRRPEFRKTPDPTDRTANPIWNCTWRFTVEYFPEDPLPTDLRLEVWDVGGRGEFLGELHVPFPEGPGVRQHSLSLMANTKRFEGMRTPTGCVCFQLAWRLEGVPPAMQSEVLRPPGKTIEAVCGKLRVEVLRGTGISNTDLLTSDPYCLVNVPHAPRMPPATWRTSVVKSTLNPIWCEAGEFLINWPKGEIEQAPMVRAEVYDHDDVGDDEFLGEALFPMPAMEGCELTNIFLQENRSKGSNLVTGKLQLRVIFKDQFTLLEAQRSCLSIYEKAFVSYFGSRPVDEIVAQSIAPPLAYFHLSSRRIARCHLRRAWAVATYGIVSDSATTAWKHWRVFRYLVFSSSLWSAFVFGATVLAIGDPPFFLASEAATSSWEDASSVWTVQAAAVVGVFSGALCISPAHAAAASIWAAAPRFPASAAAQSHSDPADLPTALVAGVLANALAILALVAGCVSKPAAANYSWMAGGVVVQRLLLAPAAWGLGSSLVVVKSRTSAAFDKLLLLYPSLLASIGVGA